MTEKPQVIKVMDENFTLHDECDIPFEIVIVEDQKAILLKLREPAFPGAGGEVLLELLPAHRKLDCFVDQEEVSSFSDKKPGEEISVAFELRPTEVKQSLGEKQLEARGATDYHIMGRVIESEYGLSAVDCGIPVQINVELHTGEIVEAHGRLVAHIC